MWVIDTLTVEAFGGKFGKVGHCYADSRSPFQSSSAVLVLQNKSSTSLFGCLGEHSQRETSFKKNVLLMKEENSFTSCCIVLLFRSAEIVPDSE